MLLSLGSVALLYLFVRRRHATAAATAAALALALSPVSILYGQSFMLEASLVFFTLGTFCALDRWIDVSRRAGRYDFLWLIAAGICLALLLLTKIYMLVVLLPLAVMAFRAGATRKRLIPTAIVLGRAGGLFTVTGGITGGGFSFGSGAGTIRVTTNPVNVGTSGITVLNSSTLELNVGGNTWSSTAR